MEDSNGTNSTFSSLAEAPERLERQYAPLREVFQAHPSQLPHTTPDPQSNSEAMMRALKALQDKIRLLEVERVAAADSFQQLSSSHTQHQQLSSSHTQHHHQQQQQGRSALREQPQVPVSRQPPGPAPPPAHTTLSPQQDYELHSQLQAMDAKFSRQTRELQRMRERLRTAELKRQQPTTSSYSSHQQQQQQESERDAATTGRRVRRRAAHSTQPAPSNTQSRGVSENALPSFPDSSHRTPPAPPQRQATRKKKRKVVARRRAAEVCVCGVEPAGLAGLCRCRPVPGVHYRMDLRDVPFVVGTSAEASHSVGANYQRVLSLMKSHTPLLCGAAAAAQGRARPPTRQQLVQQQQLMQEEELASLQDGLEELASLQDGLEEEFGRLTFEHQALAQELQAQTDDSPTSAQLEKQLIQLEEQLESKASQIHTVRRQLDIAGKASKTGRAHKPDGGRATTAVLSVPASGEVLVTTTVRARRARQQQTPPPSGGGEWEGPVVRSDGGLSPRLEFLKKMKSLQNTLQQDDLSWN